MSLLIETLKRKISHLTFNILNISIISKILKKKKMNSYLFFKFIIGRIRI